MDAYSEHGITNDEEEGRRFNQGPKKEDLRCITRILNIIVTGINRKQNGRAYTPEWQRTGLAQAQGKSTSALR
jgi:hypothetical protein